RTLLFLTSMYSIFLITLLAFLSFDAVSQTTIRGKIVDAQSRQPLESAFVQQKDDDNTKAVTDHYGNFSLKVNNKNTLLVATFIGYKPDTILVADKKEILFQMQADVINLKDVVIFQNIGQQKFATLAKVDLDLKLVRNTQELLRLVPGLFIAQHAGGGKAEQIFLRGFDCDHGTDIQVSVDGIPV